MPRSTPINSPELASDGNSGNPAKSVKLPNSVTKEIHNTSTGVAAGKITNNKTTVSGTSVAQPATQQQDAIDTTTSSNPFNNSNYRNGSALGLQPRELGEDEDKIARISVRSVKNGKDLVSGYGNFMLQAVSEADQEKYQIVETFTSFYAFFYGRRPPVYNFSGMLINDPKQNWMNTMKYMYDNYFRGTALADLGAEAVISYDKRVVTGYLLGMNIQQDAVSDKGVPFSFSFLVIKHDTVGWSSDFEAFIKKEQESLRIIRNNVKEQISSINSKADGKKMVLALQTLKSKKLTSDITKTGSADNKPPESSKKTYVEIAAEDAVKSTETTESYVNKVNSAAIKLKK
jgi:hypothetical protein